MRGRERDGLTSRAMLTSAVPIAVNARSRTSLLEDTSASRRSRAYARTTCKDASGRSCSSGISLARAAWILTDRHEHVGEHRAIGERFDGVAVGRKGAPEVRALLDLAEQELDEPAQAIALDHLPCAQHVARHGRQVPADVFGRVRVADQAQANQLLALAPGHVEVKHRAATARNTLQVVGERPSRQRFHAALGEHARDADLRGALEP